MLKIHKFVTMSPEQWEIVIEGARNPMNSWDRMDSYTIQNETETDILEPVYFVGENDQKLLENLAKGGPVHAKYRRMMPVWVTLTAPLYWWKEFDTYKVGTVANSCSTMHKIHAKEFTLEDFSTDHLSYRSIHMLGDTIDILNDYRRAFIEYKDGDLFVEDDGRIMDKKDLWHQMIQLLPTSYNQKRTVMLNYEVLVGIYRDRKNHKLDEWHVFCDWIRELPYSELIAGECDTEKESKDEHEFAPNLENIIGIPAMIEADWKAVDDAIRKAGFDG